MATQPNASPLYQLPAMRPQQTPTPAAAPVQQPAATQPVPAAPVPNTSTTPGEFNAPVQFPPLGSQPTASTATNTSTVPGEFNGPVQFPLLGGDQSNGPDTTAAFNQNLPLGTKILQGQQVTPQQGADTVTGAVKAVGQLAQQGDQLDTLNKLAGKPSLGQSLGYDDNTAFQASNPTQEAGKIGVEGLSLATPTPEVKGAVDAVKLAKAPKVAADIASAPNTVKNVAKGLMSLGEKTGVAKDIAAIQPMVESGLLKAGNSAKATIQNAEALKDGIRSTSEALTSRLKGMDVKTLVQPEELQGILKDAYKNIEKSLPPSQWDNAKSTTQWIFQKLMDNTPKQSDGGILPEDLLSGRQATDQEVMSAKGNQVFDPSTETGYSTGLRAIRQGANALVDAKAPDAGVKTALAHQTSLYNVLENVTAKGAPAVKKATEVANTPGLKGVIVRHPFASAAVGTAGAAALEGAGLGAYNEFVGQKLNQ